jgi:hypothetical protein
MSTPSAQPFNPFDLSPYAPKRAREQSAPEHPAPDSDEGAAVILSFAPPGATSADAGPDRAPSRLGPDREPLLAAAAAHSELAASDEVPSAPGEAVEPEAADAPSTDSPLLRARDVDRLETSLRWLRKAGEDGRLPRAHQLEDVPGLRPVVEEDARRDQLTRPVVEEDARRDQLTRPVVEEDARRDQLTRPVVEEDARRDQFINGFRVPPSLAPDRLRPPPPLRERRRRSRAPLRIALAGVIVAPIAYYMATNDLLPSYTAMNNLLPALPAPVREAELAARLVTSPEFPLPKEALRPGEGDDYDSMLAARNRILPEEVSTPMPSAAAARADMLPKLAPEPSAAADSAPPAPAAEETPAPSVQVRTLDPGTIQLLMQRGRQFVAGGDLISARQEFRRAAEAGDAAAALAMGATFDPVVLAQAGARGMGADIDQARGWYERARSLGSSEAPRRLEMLANR